ncbi:MAG: delta-60 repeat domain-containing protein [Flavobacteriales bacterium]
MRTRAKCLVNVALVGVLPIHLLAQQPFALDPTFQTDIDDWYVSSIAPTVDGKVILSGRIRFSPAGEYVTMARLMSSGQRDLTYYESGLGGGKIVPWTDRFYVAGNVSVRRILEDGTNDLGFQMGVSGIPYFSPLQGGDYHVYPDGRILMSGGHILSDSVRGFEGLYNLIWFSNTGYLDTTRTHRTSNGIVYQFEQLPDGRFICSGTCTEYEGQPTANIFQVDADGALDPTFQSALTSGEMRTFTPLEDGRILASGLVMTYDGATDTTQFVRYLPGGSLDPTFNNDIVVRSAQYQRLTLPGHTLLPGGRILLHGIFDQVDGQPRSGIALLDENGELLNTAFTGEGCGPFYHTGIFYTHISGAAHLADSMMYIYGAYYGYDDGTTNDPDQRFVTRLYGPDFATGVQERTGEPTSRLWPVPAKATLHVAPLGDVRTLAVTDLQGREVLRANAMGRDEAVLSIGALAPGSYVLRARDPSTGSGRGGRVLGRFVKE